MINDGLNLKGKLAIALNGEIVQEVDNIVVTAGKGCCFTYERRLSNSYVTYGYWFGYN